MAEPQTKQITVLYADCTEFEASLADISGPTTSEQRLEELNTIIDREAANFVESGGIVLARLPLSLTAAWGLAETREDDAEPESL